jgi:hypothetical protein
MVLSCTKLEREFESCEVGNLVFRSFSGHAECVVYERGLLFQYGVQLNYILWSLIIGVENINVTVHKIDIVHDPVFFVANWNPNLKVGVYDMKMRTRL